MRRCFDALRDKPLHPNEYHPHYNACLRTEAAAAEAFFRGDRTPLLTCCATAPPSGRWRTVEGPPASSASGERRIKRISLRTAKNRSKLENGGPYRFAPHLNKEALE